MRGRHKEIKPVLVKRIYSLFVERGISPKDFAPRKKQNKDFPFTYVHVLRGLRTGEMSQPMINALAKELNVHPNWLTDPTLTTQNTWDDYYSMCINQKRTELETQINELYDRIHVLECQIEELYK